MVCNRREISRIIAIRPYEEGRNVPYTEKSIMFVLDWMLYHSPWAASCPS